MTDRTRAYALFFAAALLVVSAGVHAVMGWWFVHDITTTRQLQDGLAGVFGAGWQLGSASLLAFGILVLVAGFERLQGQTDVPVALWIVAAVLAGYGGGALVLGEQNRFFLIYLGYLLLAGLILVGAAPGVGRESR